MLKSLGNTYRNALVWLAETSGRAARWVLGGALLLTAALLYYTVTHVSIDTDTTNMLDPQLPFRQLASNLDKAFPQSTNLIVAVIDASSAQAAEDAANRLSNKLKQTPDLFQTIYQPGQGPFFAHNGLLYLDKDELYDLSDRLAEAQPFLGALSDDPSLRGLFSVLGHALGEGNLSADNQAMLKKILDGISTAAEAQAAGKQQNLSWQDQLISSSASPGNMPRSFILIQPRLDFASLQPGATALTAIRQAAKESGLDAQHGLRMRLTGDVAVNEEELESVSAGAEIATILSFGLVFLVLITGLRALRLVMSILITLFIGLVWTAAFATFTVGSLNLISVTFAVLFIGLGVDFGIQFSMRYREEFERRDNHAAALSAAAYGVGGALTLAAAAAAISFFSFIPTSYRGLAELGIISGVGMFIALLANMTVLPALLTLLPIKRSARLAHGTTSTGLKFQVRRYRIPILWGAVLLGTGALLLLPQARFDFNPLNLKDPSTESVATFLDLAKDPQTTPYTLDILAPNLAEADKLTTRLDKLAVVDKTVTLASYVPENQQDKLDIIADMGIFLQPLLIESTPRPTPSTQEEILALDQFRTQLSAPGTSIDSDLAASQTRLTEALGKIKTAPGWPESALTTLRANIIGDLPQSLNRLKNLLTPSEIKLADLPAEIKERYATPDGRIRIEIYPKDDVSDNAAMYRFVKSVQGISPKTIGTPVALVEGSDAVIQACIQATLTALCAALILLLLVLRSLPAALLVLLPLALASLFTTASSILLKIPFNLANIIALPLLLAIGIAFGIYLVMRQRDGMDIDDLFQSSTPRAVLFSALTTVVAFGGLAFSHHRGMSSMGLLLTLALSFALLSTLLVLPAIMAKGVLK